MTCQWRGGSITFNMQFWTGCPIKEVAFKVLDIGSQTLGFRLPLCAFPFPNDFFLNETNHPDPPTRREESRETCLAECRHSGCCLQQGDRAGGFLCLAVACMGHSDTGCCYLFYNIVKILLCEPRVSTSSSLVNGAELLQDKEAFPSPPPVPCSC